MYRDHTVDYNSSQSLHVGRKVKKMYKTTRILWTSYVTDQLECACLAHFNKLLIWESNDDINKRIERGEDRVDMCPRCGARIRRDIDFDGDTFYQVIW